jgi:RNA polymerase sigma factor (sigma-70 family)
MSLKDPEDKKHFDRFFAEHAPLINLHLNSIKKQYGENFPNNLDQNDLVMAGLRGLMDAVHRYDPKQGASLKTYAGHAIRGRMLDEVTKAKAIPKTLLNQARNLKEQEAKKAASSVTTIDPATMKPIQPIAQPTQPPIAQPNVNVPPVTPIVKPVDKENEPQS